ncbi:hypothetical protein BaRGS_00019887 [Batillaria attramentaria]|uniref:Uncharacterized protein n=1 Tax=Batillaria attramentaria TaxID=370345 RepID=A0ABD0KPG2_9CAEN
MEFQPATFAGKVFQQQFRGDKFAVLCSSREATLHRVRSQYFLGGIFFRRHIRHDGCTVPCALLAPRVCLSICDLSHTVRKLKYWRFVIFYNCG